LGSDKTQHCSTTLVYLVESVPRNFDEKRLIGSVFPDVAKAFDTAWLYGLLHMLTNPNLFSYLM